MNVTAYELARIERLTSRLESQMLELLSWRRKVESKELK